MIKLLDLLTERPVKSFGLVDINDLDPKEARYIAGQMGVNVKEFTDFFRNFKLAKELAAYGSKRRKEMPVINSKDVYELQSRLKKGNLDIKKPFSSETDVNNPFPEGLSGEEAEKFLTRGLRDGSENDDKIYCTFVERSVYKLKPIQKQIYFTKSIEVVSRKGLEGAKDFVQSQILIISSDNYIIDGHHRYLMGLLIDPRIKVKCLMVELPINILLPLSIAYSYAIGHEPNQ